MGEHLPVILIEVVLVFGGVLAFGWWQLRSVRRDRQESQRKAAAQSGTASKKNDAPLP